MSKAVFLGLQGPQTRALTKGQPVDQLRAQYARLTPALLAKIPPELLPTAIRDAIILPKGVVHVSPQVSGEALEGLTPETEILIGNVGAEFRAASPVPNTLGGLVEIMQQTFKWKGKTATCGIPVGGGTKPRGQLVAACVSQEVADARKVEFWLDEIEGRNGQLGLYVSVNRFNGSLLDFLVAAVPLDATVIDHQVVE